MPLSLSFGDKSYFASCTLMQNIVRTQSCFDEVLLWVTPSFHVLPILVLLKWSGRTKCQKKLGVGRLLGTSAKNKSEAGVLGERRAGSLRA